MVIAVDAGVRRIGVDCELYSLGDQGRCYTVYWHVGLDVQSLVRGENDQIKKHRGTKD